MYLRHTSTLTDLSSQPLSLRRAHFIEQVLALAALLVSSTTFVASAPRPFLSLRIQLPPHLSLIEFRILAFVMHSSTVIPVLLAVASVSSVLAAPVASSAEMLVTREPWVGPWRNPNVPLNPSGSSATARLLGIRDPHGDVYARDVIWKKIEDHGILKPFDWLNAHIHQRDDQEVSARTTGDEVYAREMDDGRIAREPWHEPARNVKYLALPPGFKFHTNNLVAARAFDDGKLYARTVQWKKIPLEQPGILEPYNAAFHSFNFVPRRAPRSFKSKLEGPIYRVGSLLQREDQEVLARANEDELYARSDFMIEELD